MFEHTRHGAVHVLTGALPLNSEHAPSAARAIDDCFSDGQPRIVFDLRNVPLIDSAGLELLLELRDRCLSRGGALQLAAPVPLCRDILRVTGLDEEINVYEDVVLAIGSFSQ